MHQYGAGALKQGLSRDEKFMREVVRDIQQVHGVDVPTPAKWSTDPP